MNVHRVCTLRHTRNALRDANVTFTAKQRETSGSSFTSRKQDIDSNNVWQYGVVLSRRLIFLEREDLAIIQR